MPRLGKAPAPLLLNCLKTGISVGFGRCDGRCLPSRRPYLIDLTDAEFQRLSDAGSAALTAKQYDRAVKLLNERGAFNLRRSMEDVADALGVSRITVYNYLNAVTRRSAD